MAPGLTKWAAIKFLPVLAKTEKSWSLFRGSSPAPNISFFSDIWCFLYLLVGLSTGSPWYSSSYCSLILNLLLNFSTIEWSKGWFGFSDISLLLVRGCWAWYLEKLSLNEEEGSSFLSDDSLRVGSFLGWSFESSDLMVVFLKVETLEDLGFSLGSWVTILSLILNLPNWLRSMSKSLGFSAIIFLISSKMLSRMISVACF